MKIYLIRHGESEANANGIPQGQRIDTVLSVNGKEQAKKISERLRNEKIDAIYSSDLLRAKETAEEIAKHHKLDLIFDKRLREFDMGDFTELKNKWEIFQKYKSEESAKSGIERHKVIPPNGESEWQHFLRVEEFLKDILKEKHENIIIVAHGGTNKIFFGVIGHASKEEMYEISQKNACLNEFEFDGTSWKVHKVNDLKHFE
jgi:broad specificity phosphatase PhoE